MQQQTVDLKTILQQIQQQIQWTQMQVIRGRQDVASLRAEAELRQLQKQPRFSIEFTSQFGEDVLIWNLFGRKTEGFFIEAGAFDGYRYSVTHALEAMGWHGLLVEALPEPAQQCRRRRIASRVVQSALSKRGASGTATFTVLDDQYGGMLSYLKPTDDHVRETSWAQRRTIQVPVTSLDELLKDHNGPIDAAILDVEGGEVDVLEGFDLQRFKPKLLMIEDNSMGRNPEIVNYMARFPYEAALRLAVNLVFIRKDEPELLERARWERNNG